MEEERPASAVLCARLFSRACHGLCGRPDILLGQAAKAQHQRRAGLAAPACVEIGAQGQASTPWRRMAPANALPVQGQARRSTK